MDRYSPEVDLLPEFDFSAARQMSEESRVDWALGEFCRYVERNSLQQYFDAQMVPLVDTAESEVASLEQAVGSPFPPSYRYFLRRCRYAALGDGVQVWGLPWQGTSYGAPWLSTEHLPAERVLVVGHYWRFADGDQLLLAIDRPTVPVLLYLHEHSAHAAFFAPSFSLALWRIACEGGK